MSTSFAYYTAQESEQFTFYRIPKALFTDPTFSHLSAEAKLLYGLTSPTPRYRTASNAGTTRQYGC